MSCPTELAPPSVPHFQSVIHCELPGEGWACGTAAGNKWTGPVREIRAEHQQHPLQLPSLLQATAPGFLDSAELAHPSRTILVLSEATCNYSLHFVTTLATL